MYPAEIVRPMKEELTTIGFEELLSPGAVESALSKSGTALVWLTLFVVVPLQMLVLL